MFIVTVKFIYRTLVYKFDNERSAELFYNEIQGYGIKINMFDAYDDRR